MLELAQRAIDRGADVIGMAGGDGSQALVASVAMAADVPLVCIPAGTRNHFALDIGLDRNDVVGALDAFDEAVERRIDLAEVSGRVFVNNVSLGVYAKIIQSPEYRDAKRQTTAAMLPALLGPDAEPFDLHFAGPDGTRQDGAQIIQVSNNPYELTTLAGFGTRARLDTGTLGIAAAKVRGASDVAAFVAADSAGRVGRLRGWTEWAAPTFTVESGAPIEAGVDGEAMLFDPPLEFRILPGALRIRIPTSAPGYSPAALKSPSIWWTLAPWRGPPPATRPPSTRRSANSPDLPPTPQRDHRKSIDMSKDKKKDKKNRDITLGSQPTAFRAADESDPRPKMKRKEYELELRELHGEVVALQEWVKESGAKICIVFEGRDTAGKGGTIKAITERVSPRTFRVVALPAPDRAREVADVHPALRRPPPGRRGGRHLRPQLVQPRRRGAGHGLLHRGADQAVPRASLRAWSGPWSSPASSSSSTGSR